jgi:hypothetical protein
MEVLPLLWEINRLTQAESIATELLNEITEKTVAEFAQRFLNGINFCKDFKIGECCECTSSN